MGEAGETVVQKDSRTLLEMESIIHGDQDGACKWERKALCKWVFVFHSE